jgi:hypothetical protein
MASSSHEKRQCYLALDVIAHLALEGLLYDRVCKLSLDSYVCVSSNSTGVGAENGA